MKATGMLRAFCPLFLCPFPAAHMGAERGWHAQTLGGIYRQISVIRCFETVNHFQTTGETMSKETFEYRYEFANGDVMEFSISNDNGLSEEGVRKWVPLLRGMDRSERNNNQKERRRHCSLDAYNLSGDLFLNGFGLRDHHADLSVTILPEHTIYRIFRNRSYAIGSSRPQHAGLRPGNTRRIS